MVEHLLWYLGLCGSIRLPGFGDGVERKTTGWLAGGQADTIRNRLGWEAGILK